MNVRDLAAVSALLLASVVPGRSEAAVRPAAVQELSKAPVQGRVMVVSGDYLAIDFGGKGLKGDDVGVIEHDGLEIGLAVVVWVDVGHTRLRVLSKTQEPRLGDIVKFERGRTMPRAPMPKAGPRTQAKEEFVPLLAPVVLQKTALTRTANVFHGRVSARQLYHTISRDHDWYAASRLDSDGSVDRLLARPWALVWSAYASFRDGSSVSASPDFRKVQPYVRELMLLRKAEGGGILRLGRFFPIELPGLGYVDGVQAETPAQPWLRVGAAAGLRPDRLNQGFASREVVASAYATAEAGEPRKLYYTGTLGMLGTLYRGKPDEAALLYDQRADLGPKLNLLASLQFDFDAGAAQVREHGRLTRAHLAANSPVTGWLSLRAGADHFEPLDVDAERDLAGGSNAYLDNGYWRAWTGASQSLPWGLELDEELSFTSAMQGFEPGLWRGRVSRRGLPGLPDAGMHVSVYNLVNAQGPDYGGTMSLNLPFLGGALTLDADMGLRYGPTEDAPTALRVSDAACHLNARVTEAWTLAAGFSRTFQDLAMSSVYTAAATYRW
ncbi:MAG: hypothetical protein HY924_09915 [Elusimicrobia bacterium]|nr:hypothetical protein [Elusimicrobiota bacterium]